MTIITAVIVSLLFFPATVFIIIPLLMLCCKGIYWLFKQLFLKQQGQKPDDQSGEVVIPAALSNKLS